MPTRLTEKGKAAAARIDLVLQAPVLPLCDLPLASFALGQEPGWFWPPLTEPKGARHPHEDSLRHGFVYFGRAQDQLIKIGFSCEPVDRVFVTKLKPLLFIGIVQLAHERALHRFFSQERIRGELFSGPRVEAFVMLARARSIARLRDYRPVGYRVSRANMWRKRTGKAA